MRLKICLVTPAPPGSRAGNRITAQRWASILRRLGHAVQLVTEYRGGRADLLIALHARKSHGSVVRFARLQPGARRIVVLTGTDMKAGRIASARGLESIGLADRVVALQELAVKTLPSSARRKARVLLQSAQAPAARPVRRGRFEVCVIGHLRPVKDPFRAAAAVRALPETSRIRVTQVGRALSEGMSRRARAEMTRNRRYRWLGERSRPRTLALLARSDLMVLSSRAEGGPSVIAEAVVSGVPILSTRNDGAVGMLGADYPGYFEVGDTAGLRELLLRAEDEPAFLGRLRRAVSARAPRFSPSRERAAWRALLAELETSTRET